MSLAVVELLEVVDVGEGEHQPAGSVPGAVDLALEGDHAELSAIGAGEWVELGLFEFRFGPLAIARGSGPVRRGVFSIGRRARPFLSRARPHLRRVLAGGLGRRDWHGFAVQSCRYPVALGGGAIAGLGAEIAQVRCLVARDRALGTILSGLRARFAGLDALKGGRDPVSARGVIGGVTEEIRLCPFAVGRDLVSVGVPLVSCGLDAVAIRR